MKYLEGIYSCEWKWKDVKTGWKEGKLHAKWASDPWQQQQRRLIKCPVSNPHSNADTHTRLDLSPNTSSVHQIEGRPLKRWRMAGQRADTEAEGRPGLRQLYYIMGRTRPSLNAVMFTPLWFTAGCQASERCSAFPPGEVWILWRAMMLQLNDRLLRKWPGHHLCGFSWPVWLAQKHNTMQWLSAWSVGF